MDNFGQCDGIAELTTCIAAGIETYQAGLTQWPDDVLSQIGNTGNRKTGNYKTGNYKTGDYNTGDYNTGDYNTGDVMLSTDGTVSTHT